MWQLATKNPTSLVYRNTNTGEECRFSKVYDHTDLGVFYIVDNILTLPYQRKYLFDLAGQMERVGIEKAELTTSIDMILNLLREKKQGFDLEIYAIASRIQSTLKDQWDYRKTALFACALCVIQDGDNIASFDQLEAIRRINAWERDPTMLAFFLTALNRLLTPVNESFTGLTQAFSAAGHPSKDK
jgi:hypothetical protein